MAWTVEVTETAAKTLAKLDRQVSRRIVRFLRETLATLDDPRSAGKALVGSDLWRYRVGDYRLIVSIEDTALRILAIRIGHRREVYR